MPRSDDEYEPLEEDESPHIGNCTPDEPCPICSENNE